MDSDEAREYLATLLNKNLRVHTTDGRMFRGALKCTDAEQNIVLAQTYEYREPSAKQRAEAAERSSEGTVTLDMTSRYLGLVVVPGHHIVKMMVEQFTSQTRKE
jgi:small nuclear ribonucleoprotein (snRNP)-like protein